MSECVVRMKTPSSCYVCPLRIACVLYKKWLANEADMPYVYEDGCLIVCQLPEGHGRLVDMNDVEGMFEAAQIISDDDCNCGYVTDDLRIEELPTIVPGSAERSET